MKCEFKNKRISGVLSVLPENEFYFDDEVNNYNFPIKQTMRLKKVMGFEKHRLSKTDSKASDFCVYGLKYLLENTKIMKEDIGAIVVVTLSPDYFLPQISSIIHGECGLAEDVLCYDISQGCCGYLIGLMQSFMLLNVLKDKKVVLFNTDILSHKVSKMDRNDFPLIGDATTITIVENCLEDKKIYLQMCNAGKQRDALKIPAGGFALPSTQATAIMCELEDGNKRALDHLHMDGSEVFNFVQTNIPTMINDILDEIHLSVDDIDYYLFHQPNKFMLKKLADKLKLPYEKIFMNIVENYGNPSGASIPLNITHNLGEKLISHNYQCCLSAFGAGLAWGTMILNLGNMDFCELIESPF